MTDHEASLRIESSLEEIERASLWLKGAADAGGLPPTETAKLMVAMDEVLSNVIRHGRAPDGKSTIGLNVKIDPGQLALTVTDNCDAFDLTAAFADSTKPTCGKQQVGGVGLLFVRSLMDGIEYTRSGGCNRVTLYKRLSPGIG